MHLQIRPVRPTSPTWIAADAACSRADAKQVEEAAKQQEAKAKSCRDAAYEAWQKQIMQCWSSNISRAWPEVTYK
jgi:hypothetical protein